MKRIIDYHLLQWKNGSNRKPLLLRGARQVGKTHAARVLGKTFDSFVEINLELNETVRLIFANELDPVKLIVSLSELTQKKIIPGKTLLFIDEIQYEPKAIIALRYFYEIMPDLHIIAAGSLLDFGIEQVGIPVGRVTQRYMNPVSFIEFLAALGHQEWARAILKHTPDDPVSDALHAELMRMLGIYLAIGGMPAAINEWIKNGTSREVKTIHEDLLFSYRQDFDKYAKRSQIKYLDILFSKSLEQLGKKFMFARVGEYQKRELEPAVEMLIKAGVFHKVLKTAGQGVPMAAEADFNDFRLIFLDVGLTQTLLHFDLSQSIIDPLNDFINKGTLIESLVGQEILAYSDPIKREELFYWRKHTQGNDAEVDFLVHVKQQVVPIEVKAGTSKRIVSMHIFLDSHPKSTYGVRYWADNYAQDPRVNSYPLYAVCKIFADANEYTMQAFESLLG